MDNTANMTYNDYKLQPDEALKSLLTRFYMAIKKRTVFFKDFDVQSLFIDLCSIYNTLGDDAVQEIR